jgi:hypothetical protein
MIEILNVRDSGTAGVYIVNGLHIIDSLNENYQNVIDWVNDGKEVMPVITTQLAIDTAISTLKSYTDTYIHNKIKEWNELNKASGIEFDGIESFPKYAVIPTDTRYEVSVRFLTWNGKIWDAVTSYKANATTIPTETEFKAVLDSVIF